MPPLTNDLGPHLIEGLADLGCVLGVLQALQDVLGCAGLVDMPVREVQVSHISMAQEHA